MKQRRLVILFIGLMLTSSAGAFDHSEWNRLLDRFVSATQTCDSTTIDYADVQGQRGRLRSYLDRLSGVEAETFAAWPESRRLAFLINAYNAWTVELILGEYPDIASIKDIGGWFGSPWKKAIAPLFGKKRTLDEIEHGMIRGSGEFNEPRIHFAVNCASIGCPALRSEAYVADRLDAQLEAQTRNFLQDRRRNRWHDGRLHVSPLFKWYREDFETGWRGSDSLADFLARYAEALGLSEAQADALRTGSVEFRYTEYDWRLNESRSPED